MVNQRELTEEGLEKNFATNTLGKVFLNGSSSVIPEFRDQFFNNTYCQNCKAGSFFWQKKPKFLKISVNVWRLQLPILGATGSHIKLATQYAEDNNFKLLSLSSFCYQIISCQFHKLHPVSVIPVLTNVPYMHWTFCNSLEGMSFIHYGR